MKKIMMFGTAVLGFAMAAGVCAKAQTDADKKFLAFAAQSDQNEIALSKVAVDKATNPDVKAFAQKMIDEHMAMTASMKPFADKWGLTPPMGPDAAHQKALDKLNGLSGPAFDKQYISGMVSDHTLALSKFSHEVNTTQLPDFKTAVEGGKNKVAAHKNMGLRLEEEAVALKTLDEKPFLTGRAFCLRSSAGT